MLKLHQLGTKMELHPWCISGCVPYALSLSFLGHGPRSPGSGKCKGLADLGILLEMQGWGEFGSQTEPKLQAWEVPALEQGSEVKKN